MKKILLPFEQGIDNTNAFIHAATIAHKKKAELVVLHAFIFEVDDDITELEYQRKLKEKEADISKEIETLKAQCLTHFSDFENEFQLSVECKVVYGRIKTELISFYQKEKIDLLILTIPHKETGQVEITSRMLRTIIGTIDVPILITPEHHAFTPITNIGYTTDLHRIKDSEAMIKYVMRLAALFDAHIHFIHVSKDGKLSHIRDGATYNQIESLIKNEAHKYSFQVVWGENAIEAVSNFVKRNQIDLVTVIKQSRNIFEAMFHNSFTNQISMYSKEPLLILHEDVRTDDDNP